MKSSDFRAEARKKLEGKWGKVALITLAYLVVFFVIGFIQGLLPEESIINSIFSLATTVIEIPLVFGMLISFFKVYNSEDVKAFDFLSLGFKNFKKSWGIAFQTLLKLIVPIILIVVSIVLISAGAVTAAGSVLLQNSSATGGSLFVTVIGLALYLVALIWTAVKSYYYSLAYIIAADNENLTSKECVNKSRELMSEKRGKLFGLHFSFIGWAMLATLSFGIGYIWLLPYIQFATIAFYYFVSNKSVVESEKVEEDVISSNDSSTDTLN